MRSKSKLTNLFDSFLGIVIIKRTLFLRWFVEATKTYRMFVRIQLISSIIFLGCVIFQLDLVSEIIVLLKLVAAINFYVNSNAFNDNINPLFGFSLFSISAIERTQH